jgi:hypothetical protein
MKSRQDPRELEIIRVRGADWKVRSLNDAKLEAVRNLKR